MTAGLNLRGTLFRMASANDDVVGGAQVTGTLLEANVWANIESKRPEQAFLQQGLETVRMFSGLLLVKTNDVRERDEFEVTSPYNHPYINQRFRIKGVTHSSIHPSDKRNRMIVDMTRSEEAHETQ